MVLKKYIILIVIKIKHIVQMDIYLSSSCIKLQWKNQHHHKKLIYIEKINLIIHFKSNIKLFTYKIKCFTTESFIINHFIISHITFTVSTELRDIIRWYVICFLDVHNYSVSKLMTLSKITDLFRARIVHNYALYIWVNI